VPRLRPARTHLAALAAIIWALGIADAVGQAAPDDPSLQPPEEAWNPGEPPRFEKKTTVYGNPSGFGAGKTGFVSVKPRKAKTKNAVRPLPPVATTRIKPVPPMAAANYVLPMPPALATTTAPDTTGAVRLPPPPKRSPEVDAYEPLGLRLGTFIVKPAVEISGGYDTNPARTKDGKGSGIMVVEPQLQVRSDWTRHELRADLRGSYTDYPSLPSLSRPNFESKLDGRIDLTSQTRIDLQNRLLLSTDNPGTPEFQAGIAEPTIFTTVGGTAGVAHRFNRAEIGAKVSTERTTYRDSKLTDGTFARNDDRDFSQYGVNVSASYELSPGFKPYVQLDTDNRVHDLAVDRAGIDRDSRGISPRIGSTFELSRLLKGDANIGYLTRNYEDPRLRELNGVVADASLIWSVTPISTATFTARSAANDSTEVDVSGVLVREFGVQVDHSFRRWLVLTGKLGFGLDDYIGSPRVDHRYAMSAALTYKLSPEMQIKGELRHEARTSNVLDQDYTANIVLLGVRLQR
jgi:hypothetical protein